MSSDLIFGRKRTTSKSLIFGEGAPIELNTVLVVGTLPAITVQVSAIGTDMLAMAGMLPGLDAVVEIVQTDALAIVGVLPRPAFLCDLVPVTGLDLVATLPGMTLASTLGYLTNTQRPVVGEVDTLAQIALPREWDIAHLESHAVKTNTGFEARGAEALASSDRFSTGYREGLRLPGALNIEFQDGLKTVVTVLGRQQEGDAQRPRTDGVFQEGSRVTGSRLLGRFEDGLHDRCPNLTSWFAESRQLPARRYRATVFPAMPRRHFRGVRFQDGWVPRPGIHRDCVQPSAPNAWGTELVFACPPLSMLLLVFGRRQCEPAPVPVVTVPIRKVYFVINDVTLIRTADQIPVPVHSLSLSLDVSSWAWGFDADLPMVAQELVESAPATGPVELMASINGSQFRLLAENISRDRTFGNASIHVTGRGHNAVLASPYAPVMSFANGELRSARQLMDDVLSVNGVSMGWGVDWGLTDWNVPSGVFAHQGTWVDALNSIVQAAGGYLLPHRTDRLVKVRHRYPVAPWEWASVTPNVVLPVDAVQRESMRWLELPVYNRVFVSGQEAGVLAKVTRAGTAGDVLAPMVVDALITEAAAARQRGIGVLGDAGRRLEVSLRLPVLSETGILEPGVFVQYQDGSVSRLGLVRGISVQAGLPEVWQTINVEVSLNA